MAKKYSKTKLKFFKESIEKRMKEIATDMEDIARMTNVNKAFEGFKVFLI